MPPTEDLSGYLRPTRYLDFEAPEVRELSARAGEGSDVDRAVRLYGLVRDGIRYDPYSIEMLPEAFGASRIARMNGAFCVQKAILLAAAARGCGIPARLGYADVRNHLATPKLLDLMGTDLFVYHGYTDLHLEGRWVKATPAFNLELCRRFGVRPLEFDGRSDSVFHPFDEQNRRHMEYVEDRGVYEDFPYEEIRDAFYEVYPGFMERLEGRIDDEIWR